MPKRRVVIAEDMSTIRMNLRESLTQIGYEVVGEAADGQTAIEQARLHKPDVVVLDMKMPDNQTTEEAGIRAARVLTADGTAPCVLLTAYNEDHLIAEAVKAGVVSYLVKPVSAEALAPTIEVAIARFAEYRELLGEYQEVTRALEARKIIEKAKGVLMAKHGLTEDEAYQRIRKTSMDTRKPMRDVADAILLAEEIDRAS
jgi:response regulator NasT